MASLDELRARVGKAYSDEEFLLRAVMPADQVDAMVAAGPAWRGYDPKTKPALDLIRELATRKGIGSVKIDKPGFKLELNGGRYDVPHPIRALVFDIDGTLAKMDKETGTYQALPGAIDALSFARDRGMPVVAYTNGTFFPPAHAGLNLDDGHIVTPAVVATGFF